MNGPSSFPAVEGRIERRLLVNLRIDPDRVAPVLPAPFRPLLVDGWAIAGLCLIRLAGLRPAGFPGQVPSWVPGRVPGARGISTENVAHRIAVEWDENGERRTGVWIPQRHSSSWLTVGLGGRVFPAVHSYAHFDVRDTGSTISIEVTRHHAPLASVSCTAALRPPTDSVFGSLRDAEAFFRGGSTGVSPAARRDRCDVVDLAVDRWNLQPLEIIEAHSTILEALGPMDESSVWDSAFIMRDMPCRWTSPAGTDTHLEPELLDR